MSKISELPPIKGSNTRPEDLFVIVNLVQGDDGTSNITRKELVEAIQYEIFSRITITGGTISGVIMSDSRLNNVIIDNSSIEDTNIVRSNFSDGVIYDSTANNIAITSSSFEQGTMSDVDGDDVRLANSSIVESEIANTSFDLGTITNSTANNVTITQSTFADGAISDSTANNVTITQSTFADGAIFDSTANNVTITQSLFTDGNITDSNANNVSITQSTFDNGALSNSTGDNLDITSSSFEQGTLTDVDGDDVRLEDSTFNSGIITNSTANNVGMTFSDISQSTFTAGNITDSNLANVTITDSTFTDGDIFNSNANNILITNSDFSDGTGNNNVFTNTLVDESTIRNSVIEDSTFTGSMNDVVAQNMTITSSSASGFSQSRSTFDDGGITQSTFDGGIISNSDLVDFDMDLSQTFDPPLDEESYFAIKNAKTGETEQISYKQLFDEVSKSTAQALKVHVDAASGNDSYPGTQLQPVKTLERAFELCLEKAGGSYDRNALNNAVHISVGPGTYYTKGNLALPDDCAITSTAGQYATVIEALPGYENNNCILVGSGCYAQGFSYMNWKVDNFDYPEGGFAIAYRPGAKLLRSPYLRDSTQLSNFVRADVEPPLNPYNSKGTLDDLGREFVLASGHSGTFAVDDEITFSSGAKGYVSYVADLAGEDKIYVRNLKNNRGFAVGDTVVAESGGTGVIQEIGIDDFPNRLVGRGGGCVLADRRVLDPDSLYTYVLCFGFTPRTQNGIGYVARDGAGVNGIGSLSIFVRCAFYALNGGQMTLNNSGTQFGDISMRAKGTTRFFAPKATSATLIGNTAFSEVLSDSKDVIIEDMVEYLTANTASGGLGYKGYDADKCERDAKIILDGVGYDIALNSNYWGRLAGITYRSPISYIVPGEQLEETLGANEYMQSRIESIFDGQTDVIDRANTSFQELYNVLQYGEENMNPITWVPTSVERTAARELLQDNRSFIQNELTDWIDNNDEFFSYDSVKCRRDTTEYILPAVKYDMLLDTNYNAVTAGNAYYMASASKVVDKQREETVGAYRRLKDQTNEIIDANTFIGSSRVDASFDEIIGIIDGDGTKFSPASASYTPTTATYDPVTGVSVITIGTHGFEVGDKLLLTAGGLTFSCGAPAQEISHPRSGDPAYNTPLEIIAKTETTVTVNVGDANGYTGAHTFVSALTDSVVAASSTAWTPTAGTYDPATGVSVLTIGSHSLVVGDKVLLAPESIVFACEGDGTVTQLAHPRPHDPAYKSPIEVEAITATTITINVGPAAYVAPHTFVTALPNAVALASPRIRFSDDAAISADKRNARKQLQANKEFIQDLVMGYIDNNYFRYDSDKCKRDVTDYILPAVQRDIITGSNFNAIQSGIAYRQGTSKSTILNELPETVGALTELKQLVANNVITDNTGVHASNESFKQLIDIVNNEGKSYTPTTGTYDPVTGITVLTIGSHDLQPGDTIVLADESITWECGAPAVQISHPRPTDPYYRTEILISSVTATTITFNAGNAGGYTGTHTFVSATTDSVKAGSYISSYTPSTATYDPTTGVFVATIGQHNLEVGDFVEIKPGSVTFECGSPAQQISHPRVGDPAYKTPVKITAVTSTTITMNVGDAGGYTGAHTFVSAEVGAINADPIIWTDPASYLGYYTPTTATYDPATGVSVITIPNHDIAVGDYVEFLPYSFTFTCSSDGNATEHSYPRKGDGNYKVPMEVTAADATTITVNAGVGAGGTHTFVSASTDAVAKRTTNSNGQFAREQLQANRTLLQEEVMAYLDTQYFVFDGDKCSRDTGLILDAVRRDVATGSNYHAVFAGLSYQLGSGSINVVVGDQLTETVGAIEYLKSEIGAELTGGPKTRADAAFDEIIDILNNGTGNADALSFGTDTISAEHTNAREALQLNKAFIQAEVTAYIAQNFPNLTYDVAKCARDTGFLVDAISWDIQHGSNAAAVNFARMYYDNAIAVLPEDQILPTVKTWEHIAEVAYQVVRAQAVTPTTGNTQTQDQSEPDVGIAVGNAVRDGVHITTNVIRNDNLDWLPAYVEPQIESGYADAANKIDGQTEILQTDVIEHIKNVYNGLPYNKAKCYRDVGLIIDAVCKDVEYGGNASTLEAATYYFTRDDEISADYEQLRSINVLPLEVKGQMRDTAEAYSTANVSGLRTLINILPEEQRVPTRMAFQHLANVAQQIVTETAITPTSADVPAQNTAGTPADAATGVIVHDLIETLANLVDDKSSDDIPDPVDPIFDPNRTAARKLIQKNKDFIAEDVVQYLNDRYFTFDGDKCSRDIATIINAVKRDVLTDSNFNSVFNGLAYRSGTAGTNLVVNEQLTETVKAVEFARDRALAAISGADAKVRTREAFNEIIDIMSNGSANADTITFGNVSTRGANGINSREQLRNNKAFLQAEMTAYIADNYPSLTYDVAKCERDVGYLVDSVIFDIMHGGNSAVRNNATLYFENAVSVLPADQRVETSAAFSHLAECAKFVVQDIDIASQGLKSSSNGATQNFSAGSAGAAAGAEVENLMNVVADAIGANDLNGMPALVEPTAASYGVEYQTAVTELEGVVTSIQDGLYTELAKYFEILPYSEAKCRRDMGYVLDAVSHDIQYGGNAATLNAAYMYFANAVSTLPIEQRQASKEAFTHLAGLVEQVVQRFEVPTRVLDRFGVSTATYNPTTGVSVITTLAPHTLSVGDYVMLKEEGLTFECGSPAEEISHPRRTDPAFKTPIRVTAVTADTFTINVGNANGYTGAHTFVSALPNAISKVANPYKQDTTHVAGNPLVAGHAKALALIVANVVDKGSYVEFPTRIDPLQTWQASNIIASKELVEDEVVTLADNVLSYITDVHNGLSFPEQRCRRDIGYLVDAISHDVQYDGNYATRIATQIYFENGVSVLPADTREQTADVYQYLGTVLDAVVQADGSIANTTYTDTEQDVSGTPGGPTEAARATALIAYVEDAIRADSLASLPGLEQPTTSWVAPELIGAAQQIDDNRDVLANDMIEFINTEYNALDYNRAKCFRDVGYLVDAFSYDLNYGCNIASRWNADFYFWNNQYRVPENQREATAKSYRQLGVICKDIVLGKYPAQVKKGELGTQVEADKVESLANIFYKTQINKDTKYLPVKEEPDYTYSDDAFVSAQFIIEENKIDLAFDTVRFVSAEYGFINLPLTRRDADNLLQAVINDFRYENGAAGAVGSQNATRSFTAALFDYKGKHTFPVFNSTTSGLKYQGSVEQVSDLASITGQKPNQAYIVADDYATSYYAGDIYYWNGATWISDGANNTELLDAFTGAWDRMRTYIVNNLSPDGDHSAMVEGLFNDCLKDNVLRPNTLIFGSLVESIAHQFNGASAGVNRNALPLNFRNLGQPISAIASVLNEDGGRIRWSGADELNNQYFARGLRINGRTGRIEGRPFTSSVRKLARRASNSRAVI